MKDEIKKKIEEEALKFSKSEYADSIPDELVDLLSFKKGAEYGYSLAQQSCVCSSINKGWDNKEDEQWDSVGSKQQSVNSELVIGHLTAVNEFKQRLIKAITSEVNFDDGYDSILSVQNIIEKLK